MFKWRHIILVSEVTFFNDSCRGEMGSSEWLDAHRTTYWPAADGFKLDGIVKSAQRRSSSDEWPEEDNAGDEVRALWDTPPRDLKYTPSSISAAEYPIFCSKWRVEIYKIKSMQSKINFYSKLQLTWHANFWPEHAQYLCTWTWNTKTLAFSF